MTRKSAREVQLEKQVEELQARNQQLEQQLQKAHPPQGGGKGPSIPHSSKRPAMQ